MDTKQIVDEIKSTWEHMKGALDEVKVEQTKLGTHGGELEAKVQKMEAALDEFETKLKRSPLASGQADDPDTLEKKAAKARKDLYFKILRTGGISRLTDEERALARESKFHVGPSEAKALALGDDTAGGFLAPPEYVLDIIKGVQLISPIRALANIRTTSRRAVNYPVRSGVFAAQWIGETATRTETTGLAYSMEEVPTFEMYAEVIVSEQDLEDTVFDLEAEIASEAATQFAKAEGAAFVNGTGVKQPEGFMTASTVAFDKSGVAATIASPFVAGTAATGDGILKLVYNLKSAYAQNATFSLQRASVGSVRRLMDGQSRYIWEPNYQAGAPNTIAGIPYVEVPDMPAEGASTFPIAVGDFKRAYLIVDRVDMVIKRLNEKYAEQGQVAFIVRKRVGGQAILPEAIRKYQCHV